MAGLITWWSRRRQQQRDERTAAWNRQVAAMSYRLTGRNDAAHSLPLTADEVRQQRTRTAAWPE